MRTSAKRRSWPWWRWVLTSLSALALALSAYLGLHYLVGGPVIGCGGGVPCDQVLNSRWSIVGGEIPVSGLAAGVYLAIMVASLFIGPATESPVRRLAWAAMLVLAGAAAGGAVWFTIVQKWIIGAFCPYCMATHVTGLLLAAFIIWRACKQLDNNSTGVALTNPAPKITPGSAIASSVTDVFPAASHRVIRPLPAIGLASIGFALAAVLPVCQLASSPKVVYRGGESQDNPPAFDPQAVPLVGSPEAPYVVSLFFDYKCSHCQQLHFMLPELVRRYGGKLAVALCPTPLNTQCNPYVPRDADEFKDSCELAKVGLAVWVGNREMFPAFDTWMFSLESGDRWHPRSLDLARAKAIELVGQAKFDAALADPWIGQYLQTSIRHYGETTRSGNNAIPKLVFGSRWVIPQPNNADDLVSILRESLAIPGP